MIEKYIYIKKQLRKLKIKFRFIKSIEGIFLSIFITVCFILLFSIFDYFIVFSYLIRYSAFILFFTILTFSTFYFVIHPLLKFISDDDISLLVQKKYEFLKDDIINAVQLHKQYVQRELVGISEDIVEKFIEKTSDKFKNVNLSGAVNTNDLRKSLISSFLAILLLFGLTYLPPYIGKTSLVRLFNPFVDTEIFNAELKLQKVLPEIGDIKVKVFYPKYTSLEPKIIEEGGDASVLKNSTVVLSGTSNKPLNKAIFKHKKDKDIEKIDMNVKNRTNPEVTLKVTEELNYWIELIDSDGNRNKEMTMHTIFVLEDERPHVNLIFPQQDLMIAPNAELKLVYEYSDDFGVVSVHLVYEKDKLIKKVSIELLNIPKLHKVSEYTWDIGMLGLSFGDTITFYMEVTDNDTESGPKTGMSQKIRLIVPTIEKFLELSSPLNKEKAEEMLKDSQNLYERHAEFLKALEKFKDTGKFDMERLMGDLEMLGMYLKSLQNSLVDLAQVVPEELINKENVKDLKVGDIDKLLSELKKSIEAGDYEKAEKIAKELTKRLSELLKDLAGLLNSSKSGRYVGLKNKAKNLISEVSKLLKQEKELHGQSNEVDKEQTQLMLNEQAKLLKKLTEMQKEILNFAKKFKEDVLRKNIQEIVAEASSIINSLLSPMEETYTEFLNLKIKNSIKNLENVVNTTNGFLTAKKSFFNLKEEKFARANKEEKAVLEATFKDSQYIKESYEKIRNTEAEILDILREEAGKTDKFMDKDKLSAINKKQKTVREKTGDFKQKLEEFSKNGISVNEMLNNTNNAMGSMKDVEANLEKLKLKNAISKEQEAIYYLEKLKKDADELSDKLGSMEGGGSVLVVSGTKKGMTGGGILGVLEGYVKIPAEREYKPPKAFREDIMDSLKEKLPAKYREQIEEYYKKLLR